jgi:hypothetical protein
MSNQNEVALDEDMQTCKDTIKKLHILSKLRKMCQNDRTSTKLTFPIQLSLLTGLSSWITRRNISTNTTCLCEEESQRLYELV